MAICPLYGPLLPLRRSVPSTALYPLYDILFLQQPPARSTTLCLLDSPLFPLSSSVPLKALCPLYGPLSPLRPSVPSMALSPLYGLLFPRRPSENSETSTSLVSWNVLQNAFCQNSKDCRDLFRISDDRDHRDNHDYHSSEILSDNREIAIIALAKKGCDNHIQQKAIIVFREKLKTPFRINPKCRREGRGASLAHTE